MRPQRAGGAARSTRAIQRSADQTRERLDAVERSVSARQDSADEEIAWLKRSLRAAVRRIEILEEVEFTEVDGGGA